VAEILQNLRQHLLMKWFSLLRGNSDELGELATQNPHGVKIRIGGPGLRWPSGPLHA